MTVKQKQVHGIAPDLASLAFPVDQLDPLEGDPRRGDVDAIATSFAEFGQRKPIVARHTDGGRGEVTAGNHALAAAVRLGWTHIAVVWADDDDLRAKAWALADNHTAELGSYDRVALAEMVGLVAADPELLAATAYTIDDVARLNAAAGLDDEGGGDDLDEVPDDAPAHTRPGDVWRLGSHRLVCGDCRDPDVVKVVLDGAQADLVWTDPPYGVDYVGKTADALTIENDTGSALPDLLDAAFTVAAAACRPGACWFVSGPPGPLTNQHAEVLTRLGIYRQQLIWVKDVFVLGHGDYHYRHEPIIYGWVPGGAHRAPPDRAGDSVWEVPRPKRSEEHPTMKPVALVTRAIRNHTAPGALVLDPFVGSGTTILAAEETGRRAGGVEIDPAYCDVVCRRFEAATGTVPVLAATDEPRSFLAPTQ